MLDQYSRMLEESRLLGNRMRSTTYHTQMAPAPRVSCRLTTRPPITLMVSNLA